MTHLTNSLSSDQFKRSSIRIVVCWPDGSLSTSVIEFNGRNYIDIDKKIDKLAKAVKVYMREEK